MSRSIESEDAATCCGDGSVLAAEGYELWRATSQALFERFHDSEKTQGERKRVEALILELAAEQLWHDLGIEAAWDAFDVQSWREAVLTLDDGYRRRVRSTLGRFYTFLASAGRVTAASAARIQGELDRVLADLPTSIAPPRYSFTRFTGGADETAQVVPFVRKA